MSFLGKDWVHLKGPWGSAGLKWTRAMQKVIALLQKCVQNKNVSLEKPGLVEGIGTWKPTIYTNRKLLLSGHHACTYSEKTYVLV